MCARRHKSWSIFMHDCVAELAFCTRPTTFLLQWVRNGASLVKHVKSCTVLHCMNRTRSPGVRQDLCCHSGTADVCAFMCVYISICVFPSAVVFRPCYVLSCTYIRYIFLMDSHWVHASHLTC